MRRLFLVVSLSILSGCAQGCSLARALYVALVHNSGAPPKEERERIVAREQQFLATLPNRRLAVLPVAILGRSVRYDSALSVSIATQLRERALASAEPSGRVAVLPFEPQPNELAIFWSRFKALSAIYTAEPRTTVDYVLAVDVIGPSEPRGIGAVHVMTVTADGLMAYHAIWNSHQSLYKEIEPRSDADVARMVVTALARGVAPTHP